MPRYRVLVEAKIDVDAENEEAAALEALKKIDPDDCVAWEIDEKSD